MSISINHHYVPAFYLNNWGDPSCNQRYKKIQCWGFQNKELLYSHKSTKSICSENYLYSRHALKPEDKQLIEMQFFKDLDNSMSRVMPLLISKGPLALNSIQRSTVTQFLVGLRLRDPGSVKMIKNIANNEVYNLLAEHEKDYQENKKKEWAKTLEQFLNKELPNLIPNFGIDVLPRCISGQNDDRLHQKIYSMNWIVVDVGKSKWPLLTSDKPLVFTEGLNSEKCIIFLPLSPNKALIATSSTDIIDNVKSLEKNIPHQLVKIINTLVINQSQKWVISNTSASHSFVSKYFKNYE